MATLKGTGLEFPNSDLLSGVIGPNYVARWAVQSMGSNNDYLGLEVTMPGAKSANSKYLVIGEANGHYAGQTHCGCSLRFWLETPTHGSNWMNIMGSHEEYNESSNNGDPYYLIHNMVIDDGNSSNGNNNSTNTNTGASTTPVIAGETRKYRLYGHSHNSNIDWGNGVGRQQGWRGYLCVIELDGSICS